MPPFVAATDSNPLASKAQIKGWSSEFKMFKVDLKWRKAFNFLLFKNLSELFQVYMPSNLPKIK